MNARIARFERFFAQVFTSQWFLNIQIIKRQKQLSFILKNLNFFFILPINIISVTQTVTFIRYYSLCITKIHSNLILYFKKSATMKLIHFSDTHLGFNDLDTSLHESNRLYNSKHHTYTICCVPLKTLPLEYCLLCLMAIFKTFGKVVWF